MGEIAYDIINGECCALCGQYFLNTVNVDKKEYEVMSGQHIYEHGYPVACKDCWEPDCGYPKAEADTM